MIDRAWLTKWKKEKLEEIENFKKTGVHIECTLTLSITQKWLIATLAQEGFIFRVINLGAGVKRITTDIDCCPMCKKKLKED